SGSSPPPPFFLYHPSSLFVVIPQLEIPLFISRMADEQKPTVEVPEVPQDDTTPAPAAEAVAAEAAPAEDKPAEDSAPADAAAEDKTDEAKPVDEGYLGHKAQGASFPKNLIPSKEFFFFGSDAVEPKSLAAYQRSEKSSETAHANIAWASHTGNGLLFVGNKKAPASIINLADASEPETDGPNKFYFTSKGNKHSFKAATLSERDGWVAQLKLKIAEAKELAPTVTESEVYKNTIESFKPAEDAAKTEESAKAEDAPQEGEAPKEESKEEPKRRSASRKRASFFGFGKKEEAKAEEAAATEATEPAAETEAAAAEETPAADIEPAAEPAAQTEAATAESPKEKPASKRNSFFGNVFSKKEKKPEVAKPTDEAAEAPQEDEAVAADAAAPVIPPVDSATPLAVDVSSPATVPTEATESPANGEAKKEKRKSSLPFGLGKREKSPAPADGEEKSGKSAFSKLRATIKGRSASKAEDKPAESAVTEAATEDAATEEAAKEKAPVAEASNAAEPEAENKPENVASAAPVLTAAA
ncbi:Uncharacterized protein TCAP_05536, partial [Tolypocladium capitatum]